MTKDLSNRTRASLHKEAGQINKIQLAKKMRIETETGKKKMREAVQTGSRLR